jgi:hypothetical protein
MIINSRSSNFIFNFPRGFFDKDIEDKYLPYVKRNPLPFDTVHTMMNAHVQSVTFPSLSMEPVSQTRKFGKEQNYKNSKPVYDLFTRDMTVTMKALDGYINYWIFMENALKYLEVLEENPPYFDDLNIDFLNQEGHIIMTARFNKLVLTGISEIQLSYSDNQPEFKTFDATFRFNKMDLIVKRD